MKPPYLIIDGYNLMHAAGIARSSYGPGDLERCRNRLARHLLSLLASSVIPRTTVVYDAFESVSDDDRHYNDGGLRITFAPKGTDADAEIELQLLQHSSPRQVLVVSSDHRLHKAAQRRKARCIDSDEFLQEIGHGLENVEPGNSAGRSLSPAATSKNATSSRKETRAKTRTKTRAKARAKKVPAENLSLEKLAERLAADPELASLLSRLSQPVKLELPPAVAAAKVTAVRKTPSAAKAEVQPAEHATDMASGTEEEPDSSHTHVIADHPFTQEYLKQLQRDLRKGKLQ